MRTAPRHFPGMCWTLVAFGVWALHFGFVYTFVSLACARGFAFLRLARIGVVPLGIGAATLVALAGVSAILFFASRAPASPREARRNEMRAPETDDVRQPYFAQRLTAACAALALFGIALSGVPALLVAACP